MLNDVGEVACKSKAGSDFIGGGHGKVVVQPVVIQWSGRNLGAVGCCGAIIIVGKASNIIARSVLHG